MTAWYNRPAVIIDVIPVLKAVVGVVRGRVTPIAGLKKAAMGLIKIFIKEEMKK